MKDIKNFINESQYELTVKDWRLIGAIVGYLRGDLKHNLEDIRKNEDLKALYDKINNEYQKCKNNT